MKAKFVNEKFIEDSDPIHDMGIGMASKITSEALYNLYGSFEEDIEEIRKEDPDLADQIDAAMYMEADGILEVGDYFDWKEDDEMRNYINKNQKGRYVYDGTPDTDGTMIIFSKVKLPKAKKINYNK